MTRRAGAFIVFEGLDGSGTTTQATLLARALRSDGLEVLSTREPSDGPIGTLIRQALSGRLVLPGGAGPLAPETLALLYAADRTDHLHAKVRPALLDGKVVISERYLLSSLAYQGAEMASAGPWLQVVNEHAQPPDLTIYLRVPPAVAAQRRRARGGAQELFEDEVVQVRVAAEYEHTISRLYDSWNIVAMDGSRGEEGVARDVLKLVREVMSHG